MKVLNLCGKSMVSVAVLAMCSAAFGAPNARGGRSMMPMTSAPKDGRMLTAPIVSTNTFSNPAVGVVGQPINSVPTPDNQTPDEPTPDEPTPVSNCEDGKVEKSTYAVTDCMNDILQCVNTGALQAGLNDLYNEDVRNSIMNGMKLCQTQVDKCISDVRLDCRNVYMSSNDVWLDFNSRVVQPEYYNFVLRKTGLTPNQAENTCLLLDRNTYGSSFAAVSDLNEVNTEYSNKVGAYNRAEGGTLSKDNPQGIAVNTVGYDGNRGHYARWDAVKGECLIRVGAYNKDKSITNSWLFGAVGDNNVAEVWEKAGSTFTCDKNLFGFSLLNNTKTAAVVGVGGGTLVGGAIGAAAGAGAYNAKKKGAFADKCLDADYRKKIGTYIVNHNLQHIAKFYLAEGVQYERTTNCSVTPNYSGATYLFENDSDAFVNMSVEQCQAIHNLWARKAMYDAAIKVCESDPQFLALSPTTNSAVQLTVSCTNGQNVTYTQNDNDGTPISTCSFRPLMVGFSVDGDSPLCDEIGGCVDLYTIKAQVKDLGNKLDTLKKAGIDKFITEAEDLNKGAEIGKGIAIGAASGAAAGGLATAITAFVERNNITCKVGDGLNSVSFGKSHTIDSLKNFYVKWNLHLPDTVSPTSAVKTRSDWQQACSQFNNKIQDCDNVQINLKKNNNYVLVRGACVVSGSVCLMNEAAAKSNGIK